MAMNTVRSKLTLITVLVLIFDHLSKYVISRTMHLHETIEIIPGFFRLSYVLNNGVAFGWFSDPQPSWKPYLLAAMAIVAVIVILIYSYHMPEDRWLLQVSLAVTMGGILGNFTDRIVRGSVVDFIELHFRDTLHWPTFNLADTAITVGIAMLLIDSLKHPDQEIGRQEEADFSERGL